jgi:uncharacterized protein YtpQ (UPF0354 family)
LLRWPLAPFVQLCFALDYEHSMAFVKEEQATARGVTWDEVRRTAMENLTAEGVGVAAAGPIAVVLGPDGYASSWLAAPDVLRRAVGHLGPNIVALAPGRDGLRLVDASATDAIFSQLEEVLAAYP